MSDFVAFARSHGLVLDHAVADGRWHRTPTDDKPRKRNGAYLFDGHKGVVKNFATMAEYASFRDGAQAGRIDKSAMRAIRAMQDAEKKAKQGEARTVALEMVKLAHFAEHPYLKRKGFPKEQGLVIPEDALNFCFRRLFPENVTAEFLRRTMLAPFQGGALLIPMREFGNYSRLNSVQAIAEDGTKLFLPRGKSESSVFFIGPLLAEERWLCEGYATALSMAAALRELHRRAQVVVCFSAANLAHVGRLVKSMRTPAFVMADHDEPNKQTGKKAGEEAAKDSGLLWTMPPDQGTDANDLHMRHGVRALVKLIRETTDKRIAA